MLTLTEAAANKIADLLTIETIKDSKLRVQVSPGGCAGYKYDMFFDTDVTEEDTIRKFETETASVEVVVDSVSRSLLEGATLDYKDGLSAGFNLDNPNAQRSCGCGSSFS